jgi:diguanylate cyclase (GGDEF)-like protein
MADAQDPWRILLVDQRPESLESLQGQFGKEALIEIAGDGEAALAAVERLLPDLVLVDVETPELDGYEVCRNVKNNPTSRDIPIVLINPRADEDDEARGLMLGAIDYISRPLSSLIVYARILNHLTMARAVSELKRLASTDPLTGTFNRRHFSDLSGKELARMRRYHNAVSCLILDIDHFKRVNDVYGHDVGDEAIIATARTARKALRTEDIFARIGGEEFVALLPMTNLQGAYTVAERVRHAISGIRIDTRLGELTFTASIGLVEVADGEAVEQALKRADLALYEAKHAGRNRVVASEVPLPEWTGAKEGAGAGDAPTRGPR